MRLKLILTGLCFLLGVLPIYGQVLSTTDSLLNALKGTTPREKVDDAVNKIWKLHYGAPYTAEALAKEVLKIATEAKYSSGKADLYYCLGSISNFKGDYSDALTYYFNALEVYQELKNKKGMSSTYNGISVVYQSQGNLERARDFAELSLNLKVEIGDKKGMETAFHSLGVIYGIMGNYDRSLDYLNRSKEIAEELNNVLGIAESYESLGVLYSKMGDTTKLFQVFFNALSIYRDQEIKANEVNVLYNIAGAYYGISKLDSCLYYAKLSLDLAEKSGFKESMSNAYQLLSVVFAEKKNYEKAYEYSRLLKEISDSIYNEMSSIQINELHTRYETEKKDKEIALLKEKEALATVEAETKNKWLGISIAGLIGLFFLLLLFVVQQRLNKQRLQVRYTQKKAELTQRVLRAQMNPHFIFNSLTNLQSMYNDGYSEQASEFIVDFAKLLRYILDHTGKDVVLIREELETLKLYVKLEKSRLGDDFDYEFYIDEGVDLYAGFISPMIIQPIIENAIWHGIVPKKERGVVRVECRMVEKDKLEWIISDSGVGFKAHLNFSKEMEHVSKGISLTEQRLGTEGSIEIIEPDTGGTVVKILMPIHYENKGSHSR